MESKILTLVLNAIEHLGQVESKEELLNPTDKLRLFGEGGVMDSIGIVMLITEIEERVEDDLGYSITLTDDRAMSQKTSPFRSVKTLVSYIETLLKEAN